MKKLFATLDSSRIDKTKIAENLISAVINNGLVFIIVKTRPSIIDHIRMKRIQKAKCLNSIIYAVDDTSSISDGVRFMAKLYWHKPVCHFLIGKKGLEKEFAIACQDLKEEVEILEKKFDFDILCYVEPLDEQLEFYADEFTKRLIMNAFGSLLD